jgi:hypothetical protein
LQLRGRSSRQRGTS